MNKHLRFVLAVGVSTAWFGPVRAAPDQQAVGALVARTLAPLTGQPEAQLQAANEIAARHPQNAEIYRVRARIEQTLGRGDDALVDIHRSLAIEPDSIYTLDLGAFILATLCRDTEAREMYRRVVELGKTADRQITFREVGTATTELAQPRLNGDVNCSPAELR